MNLVLTVLFPRPAVLSSNSTRLWRFLSVFGVRVIKQSSARRTPPPPPSHLHPSPPPPLQPVLQSPQLCPLTKYLSGFLPCFRHEKCTQVTLRHGCLIFQAQADPLPPPPSPSPTPVTSFPQGLREQFAVSLGN